jgi:hypothetical protein
MGQIEQIDWKTVRKHVYASRNTPKEIKGLLVTFFEAGDWDINIDGTSWIHVRPFEPPISNIEMLTDMHFRQFSITLPVEPYPFAGPPYGRCDVDINTETEDVYLKCLASWYPPSTKLDLNAKLLASYIINRIRSKLYFILERLPK